MRRSHIAIGAKTIQANGFGWKSQNKQKKRQQGEAIPLSGKPRNGLELEHPSKASGFNALVVALLGGGGRSGERNAVGEVGHRGLLLKGTLGLRSSPLFLAPGLTTRKTNFCNTGPSLQYSSAEICLEPRAETNCSFTEHFSLGICHPDKIRHTPPRNAQVQLSDAHSLPNTMQFPYPTLS